MKEEDRWHLYIPVNHFLFVLLIKPQLDKISPITATNEHKYDEFYCVANRNLSLRAGPRTSEDTLLSCGSTHDEVLFDLRSIGISHEISGQETAEVILQAKISICRVAADLTSFSWVWQHCYYIFMTDASVGEKQVKNNAHFKNGP